MNKSDKKVQNQRIFMFETKNSIKSLIFEKIKWFEDYDDVINLEIETLEISWDRKWNN